jgi:hypothetical protein
MEEPDMRRHRTANLCREVLLSYRLIFGQKTSSSKTFSQRYSKKLPAPEAKDGGGVPVDPLLKELCSTFWKNVPLYTEIGAMPPKRQYLASKDFPSFQERLIKLQRFVADQDQTDFMTLVHDRRDICEFPSFQKSILCIVKVKAKGGLIHYGGGSGKQSNLKQSQKLKGGCKLTDLYLRSEILDILERGCCRRAVCHSQLCSSCSCSTSAEIEMTKFSGLLYICWLQLRVPERARPVLASFSWASNTCQSI